MAVCAIGTEICLDMAPTELLTSPALRVIAKFGTNTNFLANKKILGLKFYDFSDPSYWLFTFTPATKETLNHEKFSANKNT